MPLRKVDVPEAGVAFRQVRGERQRALALGLGFLDPVLALIFVLEPRSVSKSDSGMCGGVVWIHCDCALKLLDRMLDVIEVLGLFEVATAAQVRIVSGRIGIRSEEHTSELQ